MKIACLGWGSLVWDPRDLPIRKPWFKDGPLLPIEFARHSKGDRITLVLINNGRPVRSLWTTLSTTKLKIALMELAARERINEKYMGYWSQDFSSKHEFVEPIGNWASQKGLEAVVWTALPPKFKNNSGKVPSIDNVITFLRDLPYEKRQYAEEYIRKAPRQIDTYYRKIIEKEFHWTPLSIKGG